MNATTYSQKRDELTSILEKIGEIKELNEQKRSEFEEIRKKCLEDQFNIVLVGEFQGGKSTTFNTFCDGREISPRGALVKTSACRLTARNLSDQDKKEYAIVYWKTNKDLILNIEDILSKHIDLKDDLKIDFKPGDEIFGLSEVLSFEDNKHLSLINKAIASEWTNYGNNRGNYSTESLDILRIATLIVAFTNSPEVKKLRSQDRFSIDEIAKLIVFPSGWETSWGSGNRADFKFSEALFAFIGGIDCFIHSPNLARLGCSITDCPGLFASKWDTQVAIDTIPKSDAIIYLLRGDRAIGTEETKALREIQKMPAAHKKLFYALNMRASRHVIDNTIVPNDVSTIRNIGFLSVENENVKRYQALLAFLAEFGDRYLKKTLEESSKNLFMQVAERMLGGAPTIETAWVLLANQQLIMSIMTTQMVQNLDREAVQTVRELSGFKELFDGVEEFIVKNKAYSILITNGAEKASFALTEIENSLKNRESLAIENVAKRETELEDAKTNLERFQTEAKEIVDHSFIDDVYEILKSDFYEQAILESTQEISLKIAYKLERKLTAKLGWQALWKSTENRAKLIEKISHPIYSEIMHDVIGNRANIWLISIAKGENDAYKRSVYVEAERVKKELEKRWEKLSTIEFSFTPIDYPNILQVFDSLIGKAAHNLNTEDQLKTLYKAAIDNLILNIVMHVITFPFQAFGWLYKELSKLFGEDVTAEPPVLEKVPNTIDDLSFPAKKLYSDIRSGIMSSYGDPQIQHEVKGNILSYLKQIGNLFKEKCETALKDQKSKFREAHEASKANLKDTLDERRKVANEARSIREDQIEPRNKEIKSFLESTKKALGIL